MTVNSPHSASLNRVSLYHKLRVPLAHFRKKSLFNSAKEAYQLGLITRVVTSTELTSATEELALKLCQMSPLALKRTRDLMYQMEDMSFKDVPEAALQALSAAFDSEDGKEARAAFIEKRKPKWTGR